MSDSNGTHSTDGTPTVKFTLVARDFADREIPLNQLQFGSLEYLELIRSMADLHHLKSQAYDGHKPPFSNFRRSERYGVEAWRAAMIRWGDKLERIENLIGDPSLNPNDESVEDTLFDIAAYSLIIVCLRREKQCERLVDVTTHDTGPQFVATDRPHSLREVESPTTTPTL